MTNDLRIVSLLPSATEIICSLGLDDQLVGVTHECDFPPAVTRLPKVTRTLVPTDATSSEIDGLVREQLKSQGSLYALDIPTLESLNPQLIVTQSLCDVCAVAEDEVHAAANSLPGFPRVLNLEPTCLEELFVAIATVGQATERELAASRLIESLRERIVAVADRSLGIESRPKVMFLEWIDPPFSAGHWNPELIRIAGGDESIGEAGERSQPTSWERVVELDPDALFIACCGFSVERTLIDLPILHSFPGWRDLRCVREGRVHIADGSAYFNRPGPRLVDSLEILAHALHPEIHPLPPNLPACTSGI